MAQIWTMGELLCEIMRPEADMPLDQPGVFLGPFPSGAPANFIDTTARLGHSSGIIGGVGDDDFGRVVKGRLEADGVDCSQITVMPQGSTGVAFVTYFSDGSRRFLFHFPETPATRAKAPQGDVYGDDVRFFHIMGCSLMASPAFAAEILKVMDALAAKGAKVTFDPNIRPELLSDPASMESVRRVMAQCAVLFPGESELLTLTGQSTLEAAVERCFGSPKLELLVLKRGAGGCTVYSREGRLSMGVYPITPVDATGAGDAFDGAFLCGLLENRSLEEAARMASAAAAINTAAFGPMEGDINPASLERMMASPMSAVAAL